jgi:hypothetical protein
MSDLRTSTALRQLTDLGGHEPDPPDWVWAVARLEPSGRLLLPGEARDALDTTARGHGEAIGMCHGAQPGRGDHRRCRCAPGLVSPPPASLVSTPERNTTHQTRGKTETTGP